MGKIVNFPVSSSGKIGFKRSRKKRGRDLEAHGQLNLFAVAKEARTVNFIEQTNPFEHALMLDEQGQYDRAAEFYHEAIKQGQSLPEAYCNLGVIQSEKKQYNGAIDLFTKCLKEDPRHFEAHYNLGNVYYETGSLSLAKMHYEVCNTLAPEFSSSYYNLGLVLAMEKDYYQAMHALNKYCRLTPDEDHTNVNKLISSLQKTLINKAQ